MSDRYPWAAEVLELLGAPPESAFTVSKAWYAVHDGLALVARPLPDGRASVNIWIGGLSLVAHNAADVPATVRALLAGLRATQAALGEVAS